MKIKKLILFLNLILLANFSALPQKVSRLSNYSVHNVGVLKEASLSLDSFVSRVSPEKLADYGLKNHSDLTKITFGTPVPVFTILNNEITFNSVWRVPLQVDNDYVALLTVIYKDDNYKAVDFGAKGLAGEISNKRAFNILGMLRVYDLQKDFLIERRGEDSLAYIPIPDNKKRFTLSQIIDMINEN